MSKPSASATADGGTSALSIWFERKAAGHPLLLTLFPVVRHSLVYLAGALLVGLGNFVLVPLYTRHLATADFGRYALIEISLLIAVTVTQMGLGTTYLRWYAETEPAHRGEILASCLLAGLAAAFVGGTLLAGGLIAERATWFAGSSADAWLLLPILVLRNLQGILFSSLQAAQRPFAYGACAAARLLALVAGGYWFVGVRSEGVRGVLHGWIVGDGLCLLALLACCLPGLRLKLRKDLLTPMLRYGFPLVWSALVALLLDASGRYFLARFASLAEVARYTLGIKITNILSMGFLQPFASAWAGAAFPIAQRPNAPITYTKLMGYALVLAALLAAVTILFGPWLIRVFAGPEYSSAQPLLPWLLLPVMFRLLEYWSSLPIYLAYQTKWLAPLATASAAVCLLLNFLLVPRIGALGAALAWSAGIATGIVLMTIAGQRYYALPFDLRTCGFAASLWLIALVVSRACASCSLRRALPSALVGSTLLLFASAFYFLWDVRASRALFRGEAYAAD